MEERNLVRLSFELSNSSNPNIIGISMGDGGRVTACWGPGPVRDTRLKDAYLDLALLRLEGLHHLQHLRHQLPGAALQACGQNPRAYKIKHIRREDGGLVLGHREPVSSMGRGEGESCRRGGHV
jgi:hypothetical protein